MNGDKWEARLEKGNGRPSHYSGIFGKLISYFIDHFIYLFYLSNVFIVGVLTLDKKIECYAIYEMTGLSYICLL